jgi:hypothetical protein
MPLNGIGTSFVMSRSNPTATSLSSSSPFFASARTQRESIEDLLQSTSTAVAARIRLFKSV